MNRKQAVTFALTIILFILLLEGVSRLIVGKPEEIDMSKQRYFLSQNPLILFELTPHSFARTDSISVNSDGLVDYEYSVKKSANTTRIIVIGDSITEGIGVKFNETYAKVLERTLNENSSRKYEVINFGLSRYSVIQDLEVLKAKAMKYNPDIIILGYFLNDPLFEDPLVDYLKRKTNYETDEKMLELTGAPQKCRTSLFISRLSEKSSFIRLTLHHERDIGNIWFYKEVHDDICTWKNVEYSFAELSSISKENSIPVIMLIFPLLENFENYPLRAVHEKVALEAEKNSITTIDLLPLFEQYAGSKNVFPKAKSLVAEEGDNIHPNKEGHLIAAQSLLKEIKNLERK